MIKFPVIIALFHLCGILQAQTYYLNETKTIYENGYTYQCDKNLGTGRITLYNKENQYTYEPFVFKDGTDANGAVFEGMKAVEDDNWTRQACGDIANKFFSPAERSRVKGREYTVSMAIDSSTGKVIEVYFSFLYNSPFTTIPVSTYRKIELELKEKIWFTPTADGKKLKYIYKSWRQEVSPHQLIIED